MREMRKADSSSQTMPNALPGKRSESELLSDMREVSGKTEPIMPRAFSGEGTEKDALFPLHGSGMQSSAISPPTMQYALSPVEAERECGDTRISLYQRMETGTSRIYGRAEEERNEDSPAPAQSRDGGDDWEKSTAIRGSSSQERDSTRQQAGEPRIMDSAESVLRTQSRRFNKLGSDSLSNRSQSASRIIEIDVAKQSLLADILEDLDEPMVVFCRFRHDLDTVHTVSHNLHRESLELSGRVNELKEWQEGKAPVLAVQIQAGGVGIDLTRARVAIYYSLGLSLGDHLQSLARLQRPGQTRTVAYYYLLADGTIDHKVFKALQAKQDVIEALLRRD